MTDLAAIAAQVVDIQNDRLHKGFIRVTVHVPVEQGHLLMAAMGWPTHTNPVPVAIARLNPETERTVRQTDGTSNRTIDTPPASGPDIQARARKPVDPDKRLAQRAGILCGDSLFHKYLAAKHGVEMHAHADRIRVELAAEFVRQFCKVETRAYIKFGEESGTRFDLLESSFVCWRDVPEIADAS
jgi:hypothetical protein